MKSIAVERVRSAYAVKSGVLTSNSLLDAVRRWGPDGDSESLRAWVRDPTTQMVVRVLRELAENPAPAQMRHTVDQEFGFTSAMQLAARVVEDPTYLFPEIYDPDVGTAPLEPDYETTGA